MTLLNVIMFYIVLYYAFGEINLYCFGMKENFTVLSIMF